MSFPGNQMKNGFGQQCYEPDQETDRRERSVSTISSLSFNKDSGIDVESDHSFSHKSVNSFLDKPIPPPPIGFGDDDLSGESGDSNDGMEEKMMEEKRMEHIPIHYDEENSRDSASTSASWDSSLSTIEDGDIPLPPMEFADSRQLSFNGIVQPYLDHNESFISGCIEGESIDGIPQRTHVQAQKRERLNVSRVDSISSDVQCPPKRQRYASAGLDTSDNSSIMTEDSFGSLSSVPTGEFIFESAVPPPTILPIPIPIVQGISFDFGSNVLCIGEFAQDVYSHLVHREYLSPIPPSFMIHQKIDPAIRRIALSRIHCVWAKANLNLDTFHLACYLLDISLARLVAINSSAVFRMAAVALVLATKMEEYDSIRFSKLCVGGVWEICDDTVSQLSAFEWNVVMALNFKLELATPYTYANYMHTLLKSDVKQIDLTNHLLEVSLFDEKMRSAQGARTAHACVILSHLISRNSRTQNHEIAPLLWTCECILESYTCIPRSSNRIVMDTVFTLFCKRSLASPVFCPSSDFPPIPASFQPPHDFGDLVDLLV